MAQRECVVHAVAGHRRDMAGGLQVLDDVELVLREHLGDAVGPGEQFHRRTRLAGCCRRGAHHVPHPQFARDMPGDGERIAGQHLDRHAERAQLLDEAARVGTWRVVQHRGPDETKRAVGDRHCQAAHALRSLDVRTCFEVLDAGGRNTGRLCHRTQRAFIARTRRPATSAIASVRLVCGVKGENDSVCCVPSSSPRSLAVRRKARSIGSRSASLDASAPTRGISSSEKGGSARTPATERRFRVSVPVLSAHSTPMFAASSAALRRVISAPRCAVSIEPTAMLTVNITGRATGTVLIDTTSESGSSSRSRCPSSTAMAVLNTTSVATMPKDQRTRGS